MTAGPERRETGHHETRHGGADKVQLLESEVQRLSQTVRDFQSALTGLTTNLRTDLQEDTKKMLVTLLNIRSPESAATTGTEENPAVIDGHQASRTGIAGDKAIEKIVARLDDISIALKNKDEALEDIRGAMTSHEGQIRVLMDASQSQTPAITDLDAMQNYIDSKFEKLRKELDQSVEEGMSKIEGVCDEKVKSSQKTCEDSHEEFLVSLTKLVDSKEADLRKEIRTLRLDMVAADGPVRTQRQTDPSKKEEFHGDHKDLWREIDRIGEAHRILNVRIDNELAHLSAPQQDSDFSLQMEELEARLNITEQNAETHCFYIEEKLTRTIVEEVTELRQLLDERLNNMEDQFTNMLMEMSNNSFPGMFGVSMDAIQSEVNNNKFLLQGLDDKVNAVGELCSVGCSSAAPHAGAAASPQMPNGLENILKDLIRYRQALDVLHTNVSINTEQIRKLSDETPSAADKRNTETMEDFQRRLTGLKDDFSELSDKYNRDMNKINTTCCHPEQVHNERPSRNDWTPVITVPSGQADDSKTQIEDLRSRLDTLRQQMTSELSQCTQHTQSFSDVNRRMDKLEQVCGRLDDVSANIKELKDGLEKHVRGLQDCVSRMNATCGSHGADIIALQQALQRFQSQLSQMAKHVVKDVTAKEPGE